MDARKKILILLVVKKILRKKYTARKRRNLLLLQFWCKKRVTQPNLALLSNLCKERRYWMFQYNQSWFEKMMRNKNDSLYKELWKKEFRMSPETFDLVVNIVRGDMSYRDTRFRKSIDINKRVAIAVWRLATGSSYRNISKVFGLGRSTVSQITNQFCSVMKQKTVQYIKFPRTTVETANEIQKFKTFTDCVIPHIVGAIDGTHIEIVSPGGNSKLDYFCRKQMYSINTQAVVGSNLMFLDVATGYPGSIHDARILRDTSLFTRAQQRQLLANPIKVIEGHRVNPFLIGDGAYPPLTWLVKPFPNRFNLSQEEKKFNKALSSARVTVEQAFGLLKARWRCLLKRLDNEIENISNIIIACCVLHNICAMRGDSYIDNDEVLQQVLAEERQARRQRPTCNQICRDGDALREVLKNFVDNNT